MTTLYSQDAIVDIIIIVIILITIIIAITIMNILKEYVRFSLIKSAIKMSPLVLIRKI